MWLIERSLLGALPTEIFMSSFSLESDGYLSTKLCSWVSHHASASYDHRLPQSFAADALSPLRSPGPQEVDVERLKVPMRSTLELTLTIPKANINAIRNLLLPVDAEPEGTVEVMLIVAPEIGRKMVPSEFSVNESVTSRFTVASDRVQLP